jgi:hypothetical protein
MVTNTKKRIIEQLDQIPDKYLTDILTFLNYLKFKSKNKNYPDIESNETAIASEPTLRQDWLKPEEDEAWKNL